MPTPPVTPEKQAEIEDLERAIRQAIDAELGELAANLATTDDAHLFGANEFKIRALAHKIAAKALERHLAQKKLGWQTWVERSVVPVEFACPLVKSQGFDPKNRGKSKLSTQVCQPSWTVTDLQIPMLEELTEKSSPIYRIACCYKN